MGNLICKNLEGSTCRKAWGYESIECRHVGRRLAHTKVSHDFPHKK